MEKASLESQLGNAPCTVEDTEEMFWLRESDDFQSQVALGNALAGQYRFRDAIAVYRSALRIRNDDQTVFNRLASSYLTIRCFPKAKACYERALQLGADPKAISFPMGVWHYLKSEYFAAAERFAACLPCEDEMAIAVIYWHTLSRYRIGEEAELLSAYHQEMDVGHHTAYQLAVSVFCGDVPWEDAAAKAEQNPGDLNAVIALYGICGYLHAVGQPEKSTALLQHLLARSSCWPCISYLAAWNAFTPTGRCADGDATVLHWPLSQHRFA